MQAARGASLSDADTQAPRPSRNRRTLLLACVAASVYAVDQITKYLVVAHLEGRRTITVVPSVVHLEVTRNPGAAFSIGTGMTVLLSVVAAVVVVVIVRSARRLASLPWAVGLGLLLGGALGNLTDRVLRAPGPLRGHVVDFIAFPSFPVFNAADCAVVTGAALVALLSATGHQIDGTRLRSGDERG